MNVKNTLVTKPFYFLRHGDRDWNKQHVFMGQTDIQLNETGVGQAYRAAEILRGEQNLHPSLVVH